MSGTSNLSGLAQLVQTFLTGSGAKDTSTTNSGGVVTSSGGTTTSSSTAAPEAIAALQQVLSTAQSNGTDTSQLTNLVQNLFTQAGQNFLPTIGAANASGLYNSSTLGLLSDQSKGNAINQAATAILNYQTNQQQIASSAASNLASATKTTQTTTPQTTQTSAPTTQTQTATQDPVIPTSITSLLGAGLGAYTLYKNGNNILGALGLGSKGAAGGTTAATDAQLGTVDPDVDALITQQGQDQAAALSANPGLAAGGDFGSVDTSAAASATTNAQLSSAGGLGDFGTPDAISPAGSLQYIDQGDDTSTAFMNASSSASTTDSGFFDQATDAISSAASDVGDAVSSAASGIGDAVSSAADSAGSFFGDVGDSIGDALGSAASDVGDFVSDIFDWF